MRARILLLLSLLIPAASALWAQSSDERGAANQARGFSPEKLYQFGEIDAVNLFNGNLTLTLPIGASYPVSANLSHGLRLHYNSNLWNRVNPGAMVCGATAPADAVGAFPADQGTDANNAGLGWTLSMGRLSTTVDNSTSIGSAYRAPDGSSRTFSVATGETLPAGYKAVAYSTGGTHLRMRQRNDDHYEIEFLDGTIHTFRGNGTLATIRDRYNNQMTSAYEEAESDGRWRWTLTDPHRTQTIWMKPAPRGDNTFDDLVWLVDEVHLSAFSPDGTASTAVYKFIYENKSVRRGCGVSFEPCSDTVTVPLLTGIELPDGSKYAFAYDLGNDCDLSARLKELTLPTAGKIQWEYGQYTLPAEGCVDIAGGDWRNYTFGVTKKTHADAKGAAISRWTYEPSMSDVIVTNNQCGESAAPGDPSAPTPTPHYGAQHVINTVTDPLGRSTVHYFASWTSDVIDATKNFELEYGLPYTRFTSAPEPHENYFLSRRECQTGTGTNQVECVAVRSTYATYDYTGLGPMMQPRRAAELTIFDDDAPHYVLSVPSDWDGYGHYRKTVTSSSFGPTRTTSTDFNAGSDAKGNGSDGKRFIKADKPWLLNTYTLQKVTDETPGETTRSSDVEVCFDATYGVLSGKRWRKASSRDVHDVIVRYTRDAAGNVTREDWYGGDKAQLASNDLCKTDSSETSEYQISHTHTAGVLATSQYRGLDYASVDNKVDPATGLIRSSADTAGTTTTFQYDKSGRLESVTPTGAAATAYTYSNAVVTGSGSTAAVTPAMVQIARGPASAAGTAAKIEFDVFGRVWREYELMPDGKWSHRETLYDEAGRKKTVSELGSSAVTKFVYDRFDRVSTVTSPDASVATFTYSGSSPRQKTRQTNVQTPTAVAAMKTREEYDGLGRLVTVTEHADTTGKIATKYEYDQADRLVNVQQNVGGTVTQEARTFKYDGRGTLESEWHPESGATSYRYDSRGHVISKNAAGEEFDLHFAYDAAERLTAVSESADGGVNAGRPLKTFEYGSANGSNPSDLRRGKLWRATRANYPESAAAGPDTIHVSETYLYGDTAGRRTARTTTIESDSGSGRTKLIEPITQSVVYNDLDLPSHVTYPTCTGCGLPQQGNRVVSPAYAYGRVSSLSQTAGTNPAQALLPSVTYSANGMWRVREHANGVTDVQTPDITGMPRPGSITFNNVRECPAIEVPPQDVELESGQIATFSVTAAKEGATFAWYEGIRGDTSRPVSGAITSGRTSTLTTGPLDAETSFWCRVTLDGCTTDSATARALVCSNPVLVTPESDVTDTTPLAEGVTANLFVAVSGGTSVTYDWYASKQGMDTPLSLGSAATATWTGREGTWTIHVNVKSDCGAALISRKVAIFETTAATPGQSCTLSNLVPPPSAIDLPDAFQSVTLEVRSPDLDWAQRKQEHYFLWSIDGMPRRTSLGGSSFLVSVGPAGRHVTVEVWKNCERSPHVRYSTFIFKPAQCPLPPLYVDQSRIMLGEGNGTFTASSPWPGLRYEWYAGDSGNTRAPLGGPAITPNPWNGSSSSFKPSKPGTYWVRAVSSCGRHSDSKTLIVESTSCPEASVVQFLRQPDDLQVHAGRAFSIGVVVSSSAPVKWLEETREIGGGETITLQRSRTARFTAMANSGCHVARSREAIVRVTSCDQIAMGLLTPSQEIEKGDSLALTVHAEAVGGATGALTFQWFRDDEPIAFATGPATTVIPEVTTTYWVRIILAGGCEIDQSVVVTVCDPATVTLDPFPAVSPSGYLRWLGVEASGTNLKYQWYIGQSGDTSRPIDSAVTRQVAVGPEVTTDYWVRVTNDCRSDDSATAKVSVPPVLVSGPSGGEVTKGTTRLLSVSASGTQLTYQWYRGMDDAQPLAGETAATFRTPAFENDVVYWARVWSGDAWIETDRASFRVCQPRLVRVNQPTPVSGSEVTLSVDFPDPEEQYEWYAGSSGDTTALLKTGTSMKQSPVTTSRYWLRTKRQDCHADSTTAVVTICQPQITTQPQSQMINREQSATLTVSASGDAPLSYRWYRGASGDTSNPLAATGSTYETPALTEMTTYWVAVTNGGGGMCTSSTTNSATATVTICAKPSIVLEPMSRISKAREQIVLSVDARGTELKYQWYTGISGNTSAPIANATSASLPVAPDVTTSYWVHVTGRCGDIRSATAKISIAPLINTQPLGGRITKGATRLLSVAASGTELAYQWYTGAIETKITGATGASYTTLPVHADTVYSVRVYSGEAYVDSHTATLTVCLPAAFTVSQPSQVSGSEVTLQVTSPDPNSTYLWYAGASGNTASPAGTGTTLRVQPAVTTQYWLRTRSAECDADSAAVTVAVCYPRITAQPASQMIDPSSSAILSVTATGDAAITYQWYVGASGDTTRPITDGTGNGRTYTTPRLTSQTSYWVAVRNASSNVCSTTTVNSATAVVSVCQVPAITAAPLSQVKTSPSVTLSFDATGTDLKYQWYEGAAGITSAPIANATSKSLPVSPSVTTSYWARVTGRCGTADTAAAKVSVAPAITTQPQGGLITKGTSRTLTVAASGTELSYQWHTGSTSIGGATSASFPTPAVNSDVSYWVRVYSGAAWTDSNLATLTVCQPRGVVVSQSSTVTGSQVILRGDASQTGESYEWYRGASGNTSSPAGTGFEIGVNPTETTQYWLRTLRSGCHADSAAVTVTVCYPKITAQPANTGVTQGDRAQFAVSATGPGPLSYQWYIGESGVTTSPAPDGTGPTLITQPLFSTARYWVRVSSPYNGSCASTSVNSAAATATVCTPVSISQHPANQVITRTQTITLNVSAAGSITSYQWYEGQSGDTSKPIGSNSNSLPVTPGTTKYYWVRVNGACGGLNSNAALISVVPVFTVAPADAEVCQGANATFTVATTGDPATLRYQWYRQLSGSSTQEPIGSNSTSLTVAASQPMSVWCVATSGQTSTASACAAVTIAPVPMIVNVRSSRRSTGSYTLYADVLEEHQPDVTYEWFRGPIGNTSTLVGNSYYANVYTSSLPATYWVRVTFAHSGCSSSQAIEVTW